MTATVVLPEALERRPAPDENVDATVPEPAVEPWSTEPTQPGHGGDDRPATDPEPGEQTDPDETGPGTSTLGAEGV